MQRSLGNDVTLRLASLNLLIPLSVQITFSLPSGVLAAINDDLIESGGTVGVMDCRWKLLMLLSEVLLRSSRRLNLKMDTRWSEHLR